MSTFKRACPPFCITLISTAISIFAGSPQGGRQIASAAGVTVFEGARLITADGSGPIEDSAFVVADDKFTAVGRKGDVRAPAGAAHLDLSGKTVMPAIVDAHGHLGFLDAATGKMSKAIFTRENYIDHLQRYAYHGVAATISTGTGKSADFIVLDANPLEKISNVRRINKVSLRGQEVDRAGLRAKWQAQWTTR